MRVDIIIPIYNALNEVKECINSLIKYTNLKNNRIILINDCSTDQEVSCFLRTYEDMEGFILLENKTNLGFVKTCNKGISLSDNDVILLNSDTEVTKNWLEKLHNCAYSFHKIATVTPFTNNGTICSVPNFLEDNDLPNDLTADEFSDLIEKISFKKYPVIPTAVGFCMYIKREVINLIGLLDEKNFGKGYGEENDFCCRAIENGYINVLCDDTFIYHKGSMSFKESKRQLIEKNLKTLNNLYPYYDERVRNFIQNNPLKILQENIKLHLKLNNKKRNILYLVHNGITRPINHPIGGTEYHLKDLISNLSEYNSFVLVKSQKSLFLQAYIDSEIIEFEFDLENQIYLENFYSKEYYEKLNYLIDILNIDIIHIQHFKTHTFDIVNIAKEKNIPIMLTIHDYYLICPSCNLLNSNNKYCLDENERINCDSCSKKMFGYNSNFVKILNENTKSILNKIDKIFIPSYSAKKIIEDYYQLINSNIQVIEHGIRVNNANENHNKNTDKYFRVAFIGGLSFEKGSNLVHNLITLNNDKKIKWHIIGNLGDQRLNLLEREDLIKYGRYEREDIVKIINKMQIDLVCILSVIPETFSYTLSEAWSANIPVLAIDIGALSERIKKYNAGFLIPQNSNAKDILDKIIEIKNNNSLYKEIENNVINIKTKLISEMAEDYKKEYVKFTKNSSRNNLRNMDYFYFYNAYIRGNLYNENININNIELSKKIIELENELNEIKNTLGWKLLNVNRKKFPIINRALKKILYIYLRFTNYKK